MATWMDLEGILPSKRSQTEKDKHCMISLICEIYERKQVNRWEFSGTENKQVAARGDGAGEKKKIGEGDGQV